ncbi:MAG: MAPEG family protein [Alphaproteobacteria bacterium]
MESFAAEAPFITLFVSSLLVLMKLVLGLRVSLYRNKINVAWGDNGDDQLIRRIRAHANHSEWVPATVIILGLVEMVGVQPVIVGVLGAIVLISRSLHAIGLMGNAESFNRASGIAMNWIALLLASIIGIVEFFAPGSF